MKAISALLVSALLLTGCSQAIDYFYSKDNFTARSFDADLSECRRQSPSIAALQASVAEQRVEIDDAIVRDCMTAKGYKIETETK
jgi:PBP1b-binding outer membrane lipoprotein LpoB